ncbi:hypothetical protein [Miltoncostaea oceani]|uniref:hypothetical protein n=1 Tax=Miltoncostaea oceani TaxID=2843216 RepID=UPI001C3C6646|nr:hypothetical protein [Miltoncostaea oceani]
MSVHREVIHGATIYVRDDKTLHRTDGPAVIHSNGTKEWVIHGKLHRTDGPALERPVGESEYWLNGVRVSAEEWERMRRHVEVVRSTVPSGPPA